MIFLQKEHKPKQDSLRKKIRIADLKNNPQVYSFRPTAFLWRCLAGAHSLWRCG
jgi:hypothetical protein